MSAGTGVKHSEFNASKDKACRLLQVWFLPANEGDKPSYEQKLFTRDDKKNKLKLVVSPDARENSVGIHQDVEIYASVLEKDKILKQSIESRNVWVQLAVGNLEVNGEKLKEGDGISFENEKELNIKALSDESEFVIFSLGK
jgi:redox-sensitive bicupin YhaK (pirin superfamily)